MRVCHARSGTSLSTAAICHDRAEVLRITRSLSCLDVISGDCARQISVCSACRLIALKGQCHCLVSSSQCGFKLGTTLPFVGIRMRPALCLSAPHQSRRRKRATEKPPAETNFSSLLFPAYLLARTVVMDGTGPFPAACTAAAPTRRDRDHPRSCRRRSVRHRRRPFPPPRHKFSGMPSLRVPRPPLTQSRRSTRERRGRSSLRPVPLPTERRTGAP